jgi:EmrB/QacA subfamily drug resistance transporter
MTRTDTSASRPARERQHPNRTLLVLSLGAISFALGQTTLIPALTDIQKHFGASSSGIAWLVTAYFLSASIATPIAGRLGDMFGKRRMLSISLGFLAFGSLVSAIGGSLDVVIIGRALQGFGGGVFPLSFGIVRDEFEVSKVPASIGLLGSTIGVGGGVGLPLGGLIADHVSFSWVFWIGGAFSALSLVTTELFVPESPVRSPGKVDVRGALVLSVGLIIPLIGVSRASEWGWGSPRVLGALAIGALILYGFVELEKRTPEPLVNMKTLGRRVVLTTDIATFLVGFALFGSFILLPQLAQEPKSTGYGFGLNAALAGLLLMPNALVNLVIGPLSGRLGGARGARLPLLIGCLLSGVGLGLLAVFHASPLEVVLFGTLYGIGIGFAYSAMPNLVIEAVDQHETGEATGVNTIMRNVGASLGSAVTGSLLASSAGAGGIPTDSGFTAALAVASAGALVATAMALTIPRRVEREPAGAMAVEPAS